MGNLVRDALRYVEQMDAQEWILFAIVGVIIGGLCMRGFGTRSGF